MEVRETSLSIRRENSERIVKRPAFSIVLLHTRCRKIAFTCRSSVALDQKLYWTEREFKAAGSACQCSLGVVDFKDDFVECADPFRELARKRFDDSLLQSGLGLDWSHERFSWGAVDSGFDPKGGFSSIGVTYAVSNPALPRFRREHCPLERMHT